MPQPTKGPRLGGSPAHQRLMLANLATSLFQHGRITTTEAKARRLRPYAERLITKAKRGDLHNRRQIQKVIRDKDVVHRLIAEIAPHFANRNGGYTRITKTLPRKGDNAPMAVIELVREPTAGEAAERSRRVAASRQAAAAATASETESEVPQPPAEGSADDSSASADSSPSPDSADSPDEAGSEKADSGGAASADEASGDTGQEKS